MLKSQMFDIQLRHDRIAPVTPALLMLESVGEARHTFNFTDLRHDNDRLAQPAVLQVETDCGASRRARH